ncbi:MAG TPA: DUF5522 domain-containing protein [Candidatus Methylomirabilis sp.]|nr:DUF5522 domain-containing protein [Candidatus Methylomirabilis sp.]
MFAEYYLRERGYCCTNGCRHCPYGFELIDPARVPDAPLSEKAG